MFDKHIMALMDTGADVSILNVNKLFEKYKLLVTITVLKPACGTQLPVLGANTRYRGQLK
jgi:hypothetical protein